MTALAEKITTKLTTELSPLEEEEKLEVMSRLAVAMGLIDVHEAIENTIAERRLDDLKSGRDKGMTHEEVFAAYRR